MTKYKHDDFADDDSVGSVQLTEGISTSATHIRYHTGTSMWKKRSMLEKALLAICGMLLFVVIVLSFMVHSADKQINKQRKKSTVCLNESCVHISSNILASMDSNVNPCDDFYAFACNKWAKSNPIPDGKTTWGTFMKLEQQNQYIIKQVLEKPVNSYKSKAIEKAKMYYESCMDVNNTVEKEGGKPMLDLLKQLGGWNITTKNFNISKWNFQQTLQLVQNKYYIGALFSYAVGEDDRNSTRHVLQIDQSGLTLPTRENYLNKTEHANVLEAYLDYATQIGVLLGGEENATRKQMQAVIEFETRLANITTPREFRRDQESIYNLLKMSELQEKAGFIDWRGFFEHGMRIVNKKVYNKEPVVVYAIEYLQNLTALIQEYQNTTEGNVTLNNYLVWQTVRSFAGCLSKAFRDAYKGLRKALIGSEGGDEPQWRACVADTNNALGFAIGAIFVKEVFHSDSKVHAEAMINNVRNAFKKNFRNLDWMDEETRKAAEIKADAISDMIGYPEFILDTNQLDEKYKSFDVRNDTYFINNLNLNLYTLRKNLEKINEPVNKTTWNMVPSTVNAYYTSTKNQMVFPAGILQSPFYDSVFSDSLNYGGMGVVMGHELTHGFDDQGREFDKDGNLHRWWNNATIEKFKARTECVADQYSRFKVGGKNLNGNQTLGENIADNGGLKAAFHAYLELMKTKPEPQPLPGLTHLTHKQLFFIAFAQVWCSSVTKETTMLEIEKDTHSPAKFRVIGSLSNLKEFSEEFKCPLGSYMNPLRKCEVW